MFRIDNSTAVAVKPAPAAAGAPGFFTKGDPVGGIPSTVLTADWANMVQEELVAICLAAGIALDKGNAGQVLEAMNSLYKGFPSGTKMLFQQTAAPAGWTKDVTHNNKALRVVNGAASSGGTVAFTTAFASKAVAGTVGNTTLTTAQMPSHTHGVGNTSAVFYSGGANDNKASNSTAVLSSATGGDGAHTHSFAGTAIDLAVQYVDIIIATKD